MGSRQSATQPFSVLSRNAPPYQWGGALRDDTNNGCVLTAVQQTRNLHAHEQRPQAKSFIPPSSSQLMQKLKTTRTNNNKNQIILSFTFYVSTMKEKGKKSKHRKATAKPKLMITQLRCSKFQKSCLPCKALFISLFWKFKIIPYI